MFFVLPKLYFNKQMQIFYYMTSILDVKQRSHLFITSILDINIKKVKNFKTNNVLIIRDN